MNSEEINNYNLQYAEVCKTYHSIHDFRAKLLALLPFISGFAAGTLLTQKEALADSFLLICVFGAVVTFGLYIYELRGTQRCYYLKRIAKELERSLGFNETNGQFSGEPRPIMLFVREGIAGAIIYSAVFLSWIFLAVSHYCKWL